MRLINLIFGALLAGVSAASLAGGLDLLARQGLVPPAASSYTAGELEGKAQQQGLKATVSPFGPGSIEDLVSAQHGAARVYSGTRTLLGPGLSRAQSVGGLRYPLGGKWSSSIEANVDSPSQLLGRSYGLQGQVRRALAGGFGVSLGLRYSVREFGSSRIDGASANAWRLEEQGLPWNPALANASAIGGYELRLDYRYGERNSFGLTYGYGEGDAARQLLGLYPGEGRQLGLTGQHWLTPDWALSYGLMAQEPGTPRGQGLRLGLRYRF